MYTYLNWAILIALLCFSAFLSAAETALTSFKKSKLAEVFEIDTKSHFYLSKWIESPTDFLASMLVMNNIANVVISVSSTFIVSQMNPDSGYQVVIFSTALATAAILLFGELTPKIIARNYPVQFSIATVKGVYYLSKVMFPLVWFFTNLSKFFARALGFNIIDSAVTLTQKDILSIISVGEEEGVIEMDKTALIHGIFSFGKKTVDDLKIPRKNVFMVQSTQTLEEILPDLIEMGYSRIPVFEDSVDNVLGALYLKDLFALVSAGNIKALVKDHMREIHFVPETKSPVNLLKEFREQHVHMAVVLDEYGSNLGIITIEDILEEIVGDINDEHDDEEEIIEKNSDDEYLLDASMDVDRVNELLRSNIPEDEEYDTLAGFIFSVIQRIPNEGEIITWKDLKMKIVKIENHMIEKVLIYSETSEDA